MNTVITPGVAVRAATEIDNAALLALCEACPMEGDIALRVDRAPSFFALNRLEGDDWGVGVAESETGEVSGCVAVARRDVWLDGRPATACYVSDLKVHPRARRTGVADLLTEYARERCAALAGEKVPSLLTILAGNSRMENRIGGPRGLPLLTRIATISAAAIPLLWERRERVRGISVRRAAPEDLALMAALWRREGSRRQFAGV